MPSDVPSRWPAPDLAGVPAPPRRIGDFRAVWDPAHQPTPGPGRPSAAALGRHRRPAPQVRRGLVVLGIVAVALNLRCSVTSLGAVLGEVTRAWGFSGLLAGLLTSLPVAVFALVGSVTPALARRMGPERLAATAMLAASAGLLVRALTGTATVFLAGNALALAGAAVGNVLMPVLVKRYFPDRTGPVTALYTTALAVGMTGGAALTGPVERAFGGDWRVGLGVWAALALVAAPPWILLSVRPPGGSAGARRLAGTAAGLGIPAAAGLVRSPLVRALTLFFGCQSLNAYVVLGWLPSMLADAGVDSHAAGLPLALFAAMSVPMSIALPALAGRRPDQRALVVVTAACYLAGYLALLAMTLCGPADGGRVGVLGWLAAVLLGAGNGAFPLSVTLIGMRTSRAETTAAVSGLVQSGGYLLAVAGPLLVGVLHQASGGWRVPLAVLLSTLLPQLLTGLRSARPGTVEAPAGDPR
ncbi:MAG TPA: MFS transporter [Pseudonocardia sp.]|uniref:MFS transporter n=1 Tax=Pseudonocardia sp. TaxID=60912 RepID=UPI002F3EEAF0